ncbi:DUF6719 family protein [Paraburkholderia youngii]|uniref:DUF6719 family protein n=1 Tax=Paraburkholderia youngii TaxID=2782701 RepID=UPI003D1F8648
MNEAYESSRNLSTGWTDDGSVIAVGIGDYRSPGFEVLYGQISTSSGKVNFTHDSPLKVTFYSSDKTARIIIDRTDPALAIARAYENGVFKTGYGIYVQGGQTYVGTFSTDSTPSISGLQDVQPVNVKLSAVDHSRMPLLARLLGLVIPSARAAAGDGLALSFLIGAVLVGYTLRLVIKLCTSEILAFLICAVAAAAFLIPSKGKTADPTDVPPRVYPEEEPPAGTIPYGMVIYVDDGTCPAGQIKQVIGGNDSLGIPRKRACVPLPATIP